MSASSEADGTYRTVDALSEMGPSHNIDAADGAESALDTAEEIHVEFD